MQKQLRFLLVDDDQSIIDIYSRLLEQSGHQVSAVNSSAAALLQIPLFNPDCILSDLVMPGIDGYELLKAVRKIPDIKQPTFIIITAKVFEFDRKQSFEMGVDGYLTKPVNTTTFVADLLEIIEHQFVIKFWGVRGTLPVPGKNSIRYGGNTNCITLSYAKHNFLIFDAGTGLKELSNYLMNHNGLPMSAKILLTHPHYDHTSGLPFFAPFYTQGNDFEILGINQNSKSLEQIVKGLMDTVYFPVTMSEFSSKVTFRSITEESFNIDDLNIKTLQLNHPGKCIGYRVQYQNKIFCYVTDNELYLENSPHYRQHDVNRLIDFIKEADVLVIDATYTDEEYQKKIGWGHSCISRVVNVTDQAKVKLLCLYHHDPDQNDTDIDLKLKTAENILKSLKSTTRVIAPHEGDSLII